MIRGYFKSLYRHTMDRAYTDAYRHILDGLDDDGLVLDCGASSGWTFDMLRDRGDINADRYRGIEWHAASAAEGRRKGLDIVHGDLNRTMPFEDGTFSVVYALSVLEHLLNPCRFLRECQRVLRPGGTLVLLTPNISTWFTAALILAGRMPSTGPHPDSDALLAHEELFKVSSNDIVRDTETDTPVHRHLVVFSYKVLRNYLHMLRFSEIRGQGYGLYPFPRWSQGLLERVDPYHCHQMVFVAKR